jgi:hypothetical protein
VQLAPACTQQPKAGAQLLLAPVQEPMASTQPIHACMQNAKGPGPLLEGRTQGPEGGAQEPEAGVQEAQGYVPPLPARPHEA